MVRANGNVYTVLYIKTEKNRKLFTQSSYAGHVRTSYNTIITFIQLNWHINI